MIHNSIKPLFNTPINWGHPLAQGLVASYLMNEGMGDLVHDSCGMNDGKLVGAAPMSPTSGWVPGPHGAALAFDGSNDYVGCGNNAALNCFPFTTIMWMNNTDAGVVKGLLQKYIAASLNGYLIYMFGGRAKSWYWKDASNNVRLDADDADSGVISGGLHQIAFTVGAVGKIYVDSVLKNTKEWLGTPQATTTTTPLELGRYSTGYWGGLISSVSIYNRALSAEEIAYLYAFPWCMYDQATPAWAQKDYGREARLANYYRQMRAA